MASRSIPDLFPSAAGLLLAALLATACQDRREEGSQPAPQPPVTALPPANPPAAAAPDTQAAPAQAQSPAAPSAPAPAPAPAAPAPSAPVPPAAGAMDFSLPLRPISNPSVDFASYRGRKVLIFYFGPTCPHCHKALPEVQAFAETVRARGVETIAVATSRSNPEEIREFIVNHSCRLPVFWDSERKFGDKYEVKVLPTLYLVGTDGGIFKNDGYDGAPTLGLLGSRI